jgi:hypothetical protein
LSLIFCRVTQVCCYNIKNGQKNDLLGRGQKQGF